MYTMHIWVISLVVSLSICLIAMWCIFYFRVAKHTYDACTLKKCPGKECMSNCMYRFKPLKSGVSEWV